MPTPYTNPHPYSTNLNMHRRIIESHIGGLPVILSSLVTPGQVIFVKPIGGAEPATSIVASPEAFIDILNLTGGEGDPKETPYLRMFQMESYSFEKRLEYVTRHARLSARRRIDEIFSTHNPTNHDIATHSPAEAPHS